MRNLKEELKIIARPSTNVVRQTKPILVITRKDINELNNAIEPLIRRNERERIASEQAVAGVVFGGKI